MTTDGYNGWKNYPTWCVNLWLSNDEGLDSLTRETLEAFVPEESEEADTYDAGEALKAIIEDEDLGLIPTLEGFPSDLMGWALGQVEWSDIAASWLADMKAEDEDE